MPRRKNRDQHSGSCRDENVISCRFTDTAEPIVQIVERICGDFDSKARMADSFPTERLVCGYEPAMEDLPEDLVTTVVITHNGGGTLVRTMERHRGAAVILVDNGSAARTSWPGDLGTSASSACRSISALWPATSA